MRVTEKQLLVMFDVLKESCRIHGGWAGYSHETLQNLVQEIVNQQPDTIRDIKDVSFKEER